MAISEEKFQDILSSIGGTPYFLPIEYAVWTANQFKLKDKRKAKSEITGVRLQEEPLEYLYGSITENTDKTSVKFRNFIRKLRLTFNKLKYRIFRVEVHDVYTRYDLEKLVASIVALRKYPEYEKIIISKDVLRANQQANDIARRIRFGLDVSGKPKGNDVRAAKLCEKRIRRAIGRSGFKIIEPKERYDSKTGFEGLQHWASTVKLQRKPVLWPLLLLLLLFIPYCAPNASKICNEEQHEGELTPETHEIDLGKRSGVFDFRYETFQVPDQVIVTSGNQTLFDSGCIGTGGEQIVKIEYSNWWSKSITVRVVPDCEGKKSTKWTFVAECPIE